MVKIEKIAKASEMHKPSCLQSYKLYMKNSGFQTQLSIFYLYDLFILWICWVSILLVLYQKHFHTF